MELMHPRIQLKKAALLAECKPEPFTFQEFHGPRAFEKSAYGVRQKRHSMDVYHKIVLLALSRL